MKKLGWYAVSTVVTAFILCAGVLLAANLYVQSRAVQLRIRQALSANLRMPFSLKKTTFTPWDGLRIDGITARPEGKAPSARTDGASTNFLTAASFRVHFDLGGLLRGKFVVGDVLLDRPQLSWAQDSDNRWRLPSEKPASIHKHAEVNAAGTLPGGATPLPSPADLASSKPSPPLPDERSPDAPEPAPPLDPPAPRLIGSKIAVEKFRLRNGNMDFFNHKRGLLGRFEEVDVDGHLADSDHATGYASFGKAALPRAGIKLSHFKSYFVFDQKNGLDLNDARAEFAGGNLCADYHLRTGETGSPFDVQCRLENVNIDRLIKEAGGKLGLVEGRLQGELTASGFSDDPSRQEAAGRFQLVDTQIRDLPLFQAVGTVLRIDDLRHLQFKKAQLDYRLEGMTLHIEPLVLVSNNLQIFARGNYQIGEDRLDLRARLVIDEAVGRQLPQFIEQQFKPCGDEAPGCRFIEFAIGGPLNKPSNTLYQRMLPNAVNGLLDNLLRPHPKRFKPKPAPDDGDSTPPTDDGNEPGT